MTRKLISTALGMALASTMVVAAGPEGNPQSADAATAAAAAAREKLGFFVGSWTVEGREDTFTEVCEWFHERSHVVCNSENVKPDKTTRGVSVFSYVPQTGRYAYYHYGSSGVSAAMDVFMTDRGMIATFEREVGRDLVREHVRIESRPDGSFDFVEDDSVNGGPWETVAKVHYIRKERAEPAKTARSGDCAWASALDAVAAAPRNHKVVLENDDVRVLDVTVAPGEREEVHAHCNSSVMHITQSGPYRDYDADGRLIEDVTEAPPAEALPMTLWLDPQPPHAVHNLDTKPMRLLRVELKNR